MKFKNQFLCYKTHSKKILQNALLLKRNQKFEEAFDLLEKHLNKFPDDYRFYDELIFLAQIINKSDYIKTKLQNAKENNYKDYLIALLAYHSGNYSGAIDLLKNKNETEPLFLLSHSYRAIGDYQKALMIIDSCMNLYPKNKHDYCRFIISKGSLFLLSGKNDEASNAFTMLGIRLAVENKKY